METFSKKIETFSKKWKLVQKKSTKVTFEELFYP